jgi:hypothetical protein
MKNGLLLPCNGGIFRVDPRGEMLPERQEKMVEKSQLWV